MERTGRPPCSPLQSKQHAKYNNGQSRRATSLISAGKVQGTDVYNTGGEKLGDIYDVMLDKRSGRIAYAIMSFGGILGIGKQYHPLPWQTLKYDTRQGGYVVGLTKEARWNRSPPSSF